MVETYGTMITSSLLAAPGSQVYRRRWIFFLAAYLAFGMEQLL